MPSTVPKPVVLRSNQVSYIQYLCLPASSSFLQVLLRKSFSGNRRQEKGDMQRLQPEQVNSNTATPSMGRSKGNAPPPPPRGLQAALLPPPFVQMPVPLPMPLVPMSSALPMPATISSAFYVPLSLPVGLPVGMPLPAFFPQPQIPRFFLEAKSSDTNKRKRSRQSPYRKPVRVVRPKVRASLSIHFCSYL